MFQHHQCDHYHDSKTSKIISIIIYRHNYICDGCQVGFNIVRNITEGLKSEWSLLDVSKIKSPYGVLVSHNIKSYNIYSVVILFKTLNEFRRFYVYCLLDRRIYEICKLLGLQNDGRMIFKLSYVTCAKSYQWPFWYYLFYGNIEHPGINIIILKVYIFYAKWRA